MTCDHTCFIVSEDSVCEYLAHCRCLTHVGPLSPTIFVTLSSRTVRDWLPWGRRGRNRGLLKPGDVSDYRWEPGLEFKTSELPFVPSGFSSELGG